MVSDENKDSNIEKQGKFQNSVLDGQTDVKSGFSVTNKVESLKLLNKILEGYKRNKGDFEKILPGVCSFLAKAFNQEFGSKSAFLMMVINSLEIFVDVFCGFYRDTIKKWNAKSKFDNDKKYILASFSNDLKSYTEIKSILSSSSSQKETPT